MKKVYCDRCGKEVEQNGNILLRKTVGGNTIADYFDLCDTCREAFFGWLNGAPAKQEKPVKVADKPAKKSAKESKSNAYTAQYISDVTGAPVTTVRRHAEGICSTYSKDKQGRTIRYYHLTEEQLTRLVDRIKNRRQGQRTKL